MAFNDDDNVNIQWLLSDMWMARSQPFNNIVIIVIVYDSMYVCLLNIIIILICESFFFHGKKTILIHRVHDDNDNGHHSRSQRSSSSNKWIMEFFFQNKKKRKNRNQTVLDREWNSGCFFIWNVISAYVTSQMKFSMSFIILIWIFEKKNQSFWFRFFLMSHGIESKKRDEK